MTAILHPPTPRSFNTTPVSPGCRLEEPFSFPCHTTDLDSMGCSALTHDRSRKPSPASVFSVASAPALRNNENVSPFTIPGPVSNQKTLEYGSLNGQLGHSDVACGPQFLTADAETDGTAYSDETTWSDEIEVDGDAVVIADPDPSKSRFDDGRPYPPIDSHNPYDFHRGLRSRFGETVDEQQIQLPSPTLTPTDCTSQHQEGYEPPPMRSPTFAHRQRASDGSSGFIHSMKTASMTNHSLSIFQRSSRVGRSTDSCAFHGSQPRYSLDSERPISSSSFDEAAFRRGFKRQQVIDELITTEESYICDLKALVYLYSTLLASASAIPNRVSVAIERNVTSILHAHEKMLTRLHNARLRTTARRWADTEVLVQRRHQRRYHLRRSEKGAHNRRFMVHSRTRSSIDSIEAFPLYPRHSGSAEPSDVSEVAIIFKTAIRDFHTYEEYCANFEVIGLELQRHSPRLWPSFESGIESLARVIMAIDQRQSNDRRSLTVSDLLIKPIQRLTKYPLLLEQLLHYTPVADGPGVHIELDAILQSIRDVVRTVNLARENPRVRHQIQRKWFLQDRLDLSKLNITEGQFRSLGTVELCGVLHVAYQTNVAVGGCYAVCVLLEEHFLIALPLGSNGRLEAMVLVQLSDIRLEAPTDGKGLQCASTYFTWKITFACNGHYHELILSGCSKIEKDCWISGLRNDLKGHVDHPPGAEPAVATCTAFDLRSVGVVFTSQKSLSRESSVQRATTVIGRSNISHVIIRNTHNTHDPQEPRDTAWSSSPINRSQSHMNTKRIPVLEPKRSERIRLENSISDIWTRERLPFPGMIGSRGGQIIRASAGSLARKLSLASIHTPFSKGRASSLSVASKKSYDLFNDPKPTFEVRQQEHDKDRNVQAKAKEVPEVDDMRSVVDRMIGSNMQTKTREITAGGSTGRSLNKKTRKNSPRAIGPNDPAIVFYKSEGEVGEGARLTETASVDGIDGVRRRKKRWGRHWPIDKLKEFGSEAKGIFLSSSSGG